MATHSNILAWRLAWTGAGWAIVHGVIKSQTRLSIMIMIISKPSLYPNAPKVQLLT